MANPEVERRAQALLEQGAGLYEQGRLYEALSCWKQVLQLDPANEIAAEYLRFIEENFQIGVDAFIEHHERAEGTSVIERDEPPLEEPSVAGGQADPGASYEELDWSEILDDPAAGNRNLTAAAGPPLPVHLDDDPGDDDFFSQLDDSPQATSVAAAAAGTEAAAWGVGDILNDSGVMMSVPVAEQALQPQSNPLELPTGHFAAPYRAPVSAERGSAERELRGMSDRRRRTSGVEVVSPGAGTRRSGGGRAGSDGGPGASSERRSGGRRELSEMGDESIQRMLDDEFSDADSAAGRGNAMRDDVDDLEALLTRGLGELPSPRPRVSAPSGRGPTARESPGGRAGTPTAGERVRPTSVPPRAMSPTGRGAPTRELEAIVRAGMRDIDRAEVDAPRATPPRASSAPPRTPERTPPPRPQGPAAPAGPVVPLFTAPPEGADLDDLMVQARRRHAAGDFSGSLALVEQVLTAEPEHKEARKFLSENTARLVSMYRSRIGPLARSPHIRMRAQDIMWQSMDHRAGFVLSQVDGRTTYDEIIEISGLNELDATRILARLVDQGVIG